MTASLFIDTNLLVYVYDASEREKQQKALVLLDKIVSQGIGAISTHVLVEFANTVTRKIPQPFSAAEALSQLQEIVEVWTVLEISSQIVLEALRGVRDHGFSIWDAQIWATARLNNIAVVLSEDFSSGAVVEGVKFVNPFTQDFDQAMAAAG